MSLAMTLFSMIAAWMAIAMAMLWGVLRIARRHQPHAVQQPEPALHLEPCAPSRKPRKKGSQPGWGVLACSPLLVARWASRRVVV